MRRNEAFLEDINLAALQLLEYLKGMTLEQFLADSKTQDAAVRKIEVIGEAASRISEEFRSAHPEVAWKDLANLRQFYIHVYFGIKYERVWDTAKRKIPRIHRQIAKLITPDDESS